MNAIDSHPRPQRLIVMAASARAITRAAVADGFEVIAIDHFGDADTQTLARQWLPMPMHRPVAAAVERLIEMAWQLGARPAEPLPLMVGGGLESWFEALDACRPRLSAAGIRLLTPPAATLRQLRDPHFLRELATAADLRFPTTLVHPPPDGDPRRWLVKHRFSAAGLGVFAWPQQTATQSFTSAHHHDRYWQRRVAGRLCGVSLLLEEKEATLLGVCRGLRAGRMIDAGDSRHRFLYGGSLGPIAISAHVHAEIERLAVQLHRTTALRGLVGIDIMVPRISSRSPSHKTQGDGAADAGPRSWLLEINPRYCASLELIERAAGRGWIRRHLDAVHVVPTPRVAARPSFGSARCHTGAPDSGHRRIGIKFILWTRVRLTFALDRLQDAARSAGFVDPTLQWCDVPADGTVIPPSSPVVTALPGETNPSAALRRLTRLQRRLPEFLVDCAADEFA